MCQRITHLSLLGSLTRSVHKGSCPVNPQNSGAFAASSADRRSATARTDSRSRSSSCSTIHKWWLSSSITWPARRKPGSRSPMKHGRTPTPTPAASERSCHRKGRQVLHMDVRSQFRDGHATLRRKYVRGSSGRGRGKGSPARNALSTACAEDAAATDPSAAAARHRRPV